MSNDLTQVSLESLKEMGENLSKKRMQKMVVENWKCGSSGRSPVLQVQSHEFKPQSHTHTHTHKMVVEIFPNLRGSNNLSSKKFNERQAE
jgi:hypothetical protein